MLSYAEKITIINNRIDRLNYMLVLTNEYISLINSGMEDPDITIEQGNNRVKDYLLKIQALKIEKTLLANKQLMV